MIDSGATGFAFMDEEFAVSHGLSRTPLEHKYELEVFDGRKAQSGAVTDLIVGDMVIDQHTETQVPYFLTKLGHYPIVLGIPWLRKHDVTTRWQQNSLSFSSSYYQEHCLYSTAKRELQGITNVPSRPITLDGERSYSHLNNTMELASVEFLPGLELGIDATKAPNFSPPASLEIYAIGAVPFLSLAREKNTQVFSVSIRDIEKALAPKIEINPKTILPPEYHKFLDVFSHAEAQKLPEHRTYDHKITLLDGKEPPFGPLYGMSRDELKVLKEYLITHLDEGFIRTSSSPAASPVLFVRKPGSGLRFCVDYRGLNALTVKNCYPIPLVKKTLHQLAKAKWYSKIDIMAAFNKIRIAEGDEWKPAFRTRYGLYEYLVMPFGLANAPSSFQHYINDTLRAFLDIFCIA